MYDCHTCYDKKMMLCQVTLVCTAESFELKTAPVHHRPICLNAELKVDLTSVLYVIKYTLPVRSWVDLPQAGSGVGEIFEHKRLRS